MHPRRKRPVAPIFNLSVSVQIVAGRDDFAERGSLSRSTSIASDALDLSKRWVAGKAPEGHRPIVFGTQSACGFLLSLPARNERGESRREGKLIKSASSPRPSPPF